MCKVGRRRPQLVGLFTNGTKGSIGGVRSRSLLWHYGMKLVQVFFKYGKHAVFWSDQKLSTKKKHVKFVEQYTMQFYHNHPCKQLSKPQLLSFLTTCVKVQWPFFVVLGTLILYHVLYFVLRQFIAPSQELQSL